MILECPHCGKPITITRKPGAGRKPIKRPCVKCGQLFSARDMRKHVPKCPNK